MNISYLFMRFINIPHQNNFYLDMYEPITNPAPCLPIKNGAGIGRVTVK